MLAFRGLAVAYVQGKTLFLQFIINLVALRNLLPSGHIAKRKVFTLKKIHIYSLISYKSKQPIGYYN